MNCFLRWLGGLSPIRAAVLVLTTLVTSTAISMILLVTGHLATVITIMVISLITLLAMVWRTFR